jgi:hypothetical protein
MVLLVLSWIATSCNMTLLIVLYDRLVTEYESRNKTRKPKPESDHYSIAQHGRRRFMRSNTMILGAFVAVVYFVDLRPMCQLDPTTTSFDVAHNAPPPPPPKVFYSMARHDRAGSQALEMLLLNAYAYHHGATYGGACIVGNATDKQIESKTVIEGTNLTGISKFLKYACPPGGRDDPSIVYGLYPWLLIRKIVTTEWLNYLHANIPYPVEPPNNIFKIAVHIRRGDVTPCTGLNVHRYLPNSYYLDMIDKYLPLASLPEHRNKTVEVVIHSVSKSFESLDEFVARNYTVKLNTVPTMDVWMDLAVSDVYIMSTSAFSVVPALLNRKGVVVYAPFIFLEPLPSWEGLSRREMEPYHQEALSFKSICDINNTTCGYRAWGESGLWFLLRRTSFENITIH